MTTAAVKSVLRVVVELVLLPALAILSAVARLSKKSIDVGLGPEPLLNNVYHKRALELYGYSAETFVSHVYYVTTDFDVRGDLLLGGHLGIFRDCSLFVRAIFRYRCLYIYFNGGPLGFTHVLWRFEPFLYGLAGVRTVVMGYGSDVQELSRSANLAFKDAMSRDYPAHRLRRKRVAAKIDLWTRGASHVIGGCEWVDYMYHWDTLMLAHFSIDLEAWKPLPVSGDPAVATKTLRILHAPNHRNIKGTSHFKRAVQELKGEGLDVDLVVVQRVSNDEVKNAMRSADVVADQLIVGWYALFALEAMALEKPVLCYLREDLKKFYTSAGLIDPGEIPIIECSPATVKETIRRLLLNRESLAEIGGRSRSYVAKHHSLESVGAVFAGINRCLGVSVMKQGRRAEA